MRVSEQDRERAWRWLNANMSNSAPQRREFLAPSLSQSYAEVREEAEKAWAAHLAQHPCDCKYGTITLRPDGSLFCSCGRHTWEFTDTAVEKAEARGHRAGMEEAARIADKHFGYRNDEVASAIRAAMKEGK
jgi:hypothetical protein